MSTVHETRPSKLRNVRVSSTILYGLFVSRKSYLIGIRQLMIRQHADMLAEKTVGTILPQELIDLIADDLNTQMVVIVSSKWTAGVKSLEKSISKFESGIHDSPTLRSAHGKMNKFNITTTVVQNSRPITGHGVRLSAPAQTAYMHLSMRTPRPSLAMSLPPHPGYVSHPLVSASSPVLYNAGNAYVKVHLRPNDDSTGALHEDRATFLPSEFGNGALQVNRLLQCDGIEDSIRLWDPAEVQSFVDLLSLCMVPFELGDTNRMKPGLHVWQRIVEDSA